MIKYYLPLLTLLATTAQAQLNEKESRAIDQYHQYYNGKITGFSHTLVPDLYAIQVDSESDISMIAPNGSTVAWNPKQVSYLEFNTAGKPTGQVVLDRRQMKQFQNEIYSKINKDDLLKITFGDGKEQMFLYSAVDCPACYKQEKAIQQLSLSKNATIYILPYALSSKNWGKVTQIMCAQDRENAWQTYWKNKSLPNNDGNCEWASTHSKMTISFMAQLMGIGRGTPTTILADGTVLNPSQENPIPTLGKNYPEDHGIFGNNLKKTEFLVKVK